MKLSEYLETSETTGVALAEKLGVTPSTISRWASGVRVPSIGMAVRIEDLTKGKVRCRDFAKADAA